MKKISYEGDGGKKYKTFPRVWKGVMKYFRKDQVRGGTGKIINTVLGKDIFSRVIELET